MGEIEFGQRRDPGEAGNKCGCKTGDHIGIDQGGEYVFYLCLIRFGESAKRV